MSTPAWFKRNIIRPTTQFERDAVLHAQRVMRCAETAEMDEATVVHLRGFQNLFGLQVTGILDGPTASQLERIRTYGATEGELG
jgi:hypothetical protein